MNLIHFRYSGTLRVRTSLDQIYRLEEELLKQPQVDCPVRHYYTDGIYAREMTIPPWTVISGAVHRSEHLAILSKGRIEVETEHGLVMLKAPHMLVSTAGIKRIGRTFDEGAVWTTFHHNPGNCTDIDVLVERISTSKNCELLGNRPVIAKEEPCLLE
jgi:hypothetical protein